MPSGLVLIVDGFNLFVRNYIANPLMAEGQHIGGAIGFMKSLGSLIDAHAPDECVVVWEGGGSIRRRQIFPEYKSRRKPVKLNRFHEGDIPDTLENHNWQLKFLIASLKTVPIRQLYITDCEADDIIGYLAKYHFKGRNVLIASSDHDYLQLVSDTIKVWSPTLKSEVDVESVVRRYGVLPRNLCVTRAFAGDVSDAIPGVKGVGIATLVKRFPLLKEDRDVTVEEVLEAANAHPGKERLKAVKEIIENASTVKRNWRLMNLDVSNLSGNQISKLSSAFEIPLQKSNKLELMRIMIRHGVKTFDVDRFVLQVTANIRNQNV